MDIFAYVSLGLCGVIALACGGAYLISILREPIGQAVVIGCLFVLLVLCGLVSAVWLVGTKLI